MSWFKLKPVPRYLCRVTTTSINEKEFLIASSCLRQDEEGAIHKYNVKTNEWYKQYKYPIGWEIQKHSIAMNKKENKIYLATYKAEMVIVNIDSKQYRVSQCDINHGYTDCPFINNWWCPVSIVNINSTIHVFVIVFNVYLDKMTHKHLIFDEETDEYKQIFDFMTTEYINNPPHSSIHTKIHVSSKQILLLFISDSNAHIHQLWILNLKTNVWTKNETIKYEFQVSCAVLICNQQFIFLYSDNDTMYVLDIRDNDKYKLSQCIIQTPFKMERHSITYLHATNRGIKDEMLVFGWINQLFQKPQFHGIALPPFCIIKLILNLYCIDLIHFICDPVENGHTHYAINVKHVLLSSKIKNIKFN